LHFANCALWLHTAAIRFDPDTAPGAASSYPAHSASHIRSDRPDGGYDAGVQPPPPGPPPQWGPPPGPDDYGQPPPPPGYGPPQWGGYGPPAPPPTSQQTFGWISLAAIGLLGLLGAILTLTLWINLNSSVSRATDVCKRFGGEYANMCRQQIEKMVPGVPVALVVCLFLIIAACLAVAAGAVMLFVKRQSGQFLILGGGIVMLVVSIGLEARFGATSRITYDLIAGLVIAVTGGLMFVPAFRVLLGLPPHLTGSPRPGGYPGGGPWPPPPPPQYGPPGPPQQW
jgi:hypothetical protein